ncbi:hypothetical protein LTR37_001176 [Vermiconidia calcicola]|uniref:Uncharacterized protein n=1 Tax=Vermiconidia calcicola TaxID=1690605 RepID=A0ACC3NVN8_9PEZI|nr:hypothetical protein LTR37_001176 [Vermiconidia calcicola]
MRLSLATIALLAGSAVTTPLLPRSDSAPATTVLVPSDTVPSSPPSSPTVAASAGLASSPADVAIIATVYEKEVLNEAFTTPTIPTTGCVLASIPQFTDTQTLPDGSLRPAVIPEGLYCECAANSGRHEIPSTSYNTLGTMFLYCGNVGTAPVPTLISTATPVPNPGDPENPSWADVSCSYGSLPDITSDPWLQWNDSGADAAWSQMVAAWDDSNQEDTSFVDFLRNFFHAKPNLDCDIIGAANCDGTVQCGEHAFPNAPVSAPAGYMYGLLSLPLVLSFTSDLLTEPPEL